MITEITEREEAEFNARARRARAERARLEAKAAEGDVDAVWAELTRPRFGAFDPTEFFPLLLRAVEARAARRAPERFSGEVLARVAALTAYLALRSHYLLTTRLEQYDRSPQGRGRVELPPAFAERVVPQLLALHESLGQVLHTQATVARAWELARSKRAENDRVGDQATAKDGQAREAKPRREPRARPARANGKAGVNRIADLLDGPGPEANGVHDHD